MLLPALKEQTVAEMDGFKIRLLGTAKVTK